MAIAAIVAIALWRYGFVLVISLPIQGQLFGQNSYDKTIGAIEAKLAISYGAMA